jgi:hypothetical protein
MRLLCEVEVQAKNGIFSGSFRRRGLRITSGSRGQIPLDLKDDLIVLWVKASSLAD